MNEGITRQAVRAVYLPGSPTPPACIYFCLPGFLAGSQVRKAVPRWVYLNPRFSLINLDPERGKLPKAT